MKILPVAFPLAVLFPPAAIAFQCYDASEHFCSCAADRCSARKCAKVGGTWTDACPDDGCDAAECAAGEGGAAVADDPGGDGDGCYGVWPEGGRGCRCDPSVCSEEACAEAEGSIQWIPGGDGGGPSCNSCSCTIPTAPPTTAPPTAAPTPPPTPRPTFAPTPPPTAAPTLAPTPAPTETPTPAPSAPPTRAPATGAPSAPPAPAPGAPAAPGPAPAPEPDFGLEDEEDDELLSEATAVGPAAAVVASLLSAFAMRMFL